MSYTMIRPMKIWKSLLRRKLRSFFALLGVAIGVAAVVSIVSAAKGFKTQFEKITGLYKSEILVVDKGASSPIFSVIEESTLDGIRALPGVKAVTGNLLSFSKHPELPILLVVGLDPSGGLLGQVRILEGQPFSLDRRDEALLGQRAAKSLGLRVGGTLSLRGRSYRIVGIYTQGTNITDSGAILPLEEAQELMNVPGRVSLAAVSVSDEKQTAAVIRAIEAKYPTLSATKAGEFVSQYRQLEMIDTFAWVISFFAILVGAIGVMNTMMMSIFERTREIGVLRAIGWSGRRVLGMIVLEGALLSLVGGILGIFLGVVMLESAVRIFTTSIAWADSTYPLTLFLHVIGLALLVGVVGSLLPAWKASRLDPIEALRYE